MFYEKPLHITFKCIVAVLYHAGFYHVGGYEQLYHRYMTAIPNTTSANANNTCGYPREDAWVMLRDAATSDMPWPAFLLGQTPASIWYWCTDQVRATTSRLPVRDSSTYDAACCRLKTLFSGEGLVLSTHNKW